MTATALQAALTSLFGEVGGLRRLSGGASQETWAFDAGGRGLILRRRPDALPSTDESGRTVRLAAEAEVIRAVAARGAPVPEIVHVCTPADGLGEAYVMGRVEGETLGRRIVRDATFDSVRPGLAAACGRVLAAIHATPAPTSLATSDAGGELERYEAIFRSSEARRPVLELGFRWLAARMPPPLPPVLVHGDFRNGNLMIHPECGLSAVLDWELTHVGDPAEDLGWLCVNSWRFGEHRRPVGGFGDHAELLDAYAAAGGRELPLERLLFWQALGSLKWGVMCLILYGSFASGADRSVERAMIGRRVSEAEIDLLNLMERA